MPRARQTVGSKYLRRDGAAQRTVRGGDCAPAIAALIEGTFLRASTVVPDRPEPAGPRVKNAGYVLMRWNLRDHPLWALRFRVRQLR